MQRIQQLQALPDDELLRRLAVLVEGSRRTEADLVAHIGEVDARRLYAREATPSMFIYCLERLHLSEAEAYLRIAAARASREHPVILDMLADGRLHLTGIALLAPHLTPENREAVLQRATHKTKREIEDLVAELAPRPDVRPSIRKLPLGRLVASATSSVQSAGVNLPFSGTPIGPDGHAAAPELRPEQVDSDRLNVVVARAATGPGTGCAPEGGRATAASTEATFERHWAACGEARPPLIEALSPARYRVQFTASAELRDKLERLKALMRSAIPDGDLASIIDAAVTEKLERLEARRFGRTKARRKRPPTKPAQTEARASSRYVPAEVRRAVDERDGGRCRYVDDQGQRCAARTCLEFHHRRPFVLGGEHSPTNVSLLCGAHNRYLAEIDFGREAVCGPRRSMTAVSSGPERT